VGFLLADARVYLKARFCWRKIRQVKGSFAPLALQADGRDGLFRLTAGVLKVKGGFAPLASQADGRVTFVWETKVTKNS